jgi:hypothetical protein
MRRSIGLFLLVVLATVAPARADLCEKATDGSSLCVMIHRGKTYGEAETAYFVARTRAEFERLFKNLVKEDTIPAPTVERDYQKLLARNPPIDLRDLKSGKWVVLAVAIGTNHKEKNTYVLQSPEYEADAAEINVMCKITPSLTEQFTPSGDASEFRGGAYFMFVTTETYLEKSGLKSFANVKNFTFESVDDPSKSFDFVSPP